MFKAGSTVAVALGAAQTANRNSNLFRYDDETRQTVGWDPGQGLGICGYADMRMKDGGSVITYNRASHWPPPPEP
jgi:hypothetical protein